MNKKDSSLKRAFETLDTQGYPTEDQKEAMLDRIKLQSNAGQLSAFDKFRSFAVVCPWRIAIAASAVQAAVFTLIFGTQYTNILLSAIGG